MCGIVGYTGKQQAAPILLYGLSRLEYRGYDSAGVAVRGDDGRVETVKATGRLKNLSKKIDGGSSLHGCIGIGHTRWATHGEPSEGNAHPHISNSGRVVLVHNGIIENFQELREKLSKKGYSFYSETDTEVAANLIEYYLEKYGEGPVGALSRAMLHIRGSYALGVMFSDFPDELFAARKDSPLIIGESCGESFIASDVPAILKYTRTVYYIGNQEIARLSQGNISFYNLDREEIEKKAKEITMDAEAAEKGGFPHFMLKEIYEQPRAVRDTLNSLIKDGGIAYDKLGIEPEQLSSIEEIYIVACGSAYHAAVALQYVIERLCGIPVRVDIASEFRYRRPVLKDNTLCIIISQSGETADSLAALREAGNKGAKTLAIVNVVGSSIAREASSVCYTVAGPEIAVATTKAYSTQLIAGYVFAMALAESKGRLSEDEYVGFRDELFSIPDKIEKILDDKERLQWFASKYAGARDVFFLGRGLDHAAGLEGSLKLKEISYIHSEAYAAGELKHGTISLIEKGVLTVGILTEPELYEKTLSNMLEVKSRGGYLMGITSYGNYSIEDTADFTVYVPKTAPIFAPSLSVIPMQLLAYYVSVAKGLDVDKPRNLAKSVTVE